MRVVLFTSRSDLESTPFWRIILGVEGIRSILVCRRVRPGGLRSAARSFARNLQKHGPLFVPYRLYHAVRDAVSRVTPPPAFQRRAPHPPRTERLEFDDLHRPEALSAVRRWKPDLGLSIGAPILRRELFEIPRMGTLNIHGGKVPDYRGAPEGFWELYTGATEIGATFHWITEKLDAGAVVEEAVAPIYPHDSLTDVAARAEELSVHVVERGLRAVVEGRATATPQPPGGRTFRFPSPAMRLRLHLRLWGRRFLGAWTSLRESVANLVRGLLIYLVRPLRDLVRTIRGTHPIRVFTFHRVTNLCRDGMTVSPAVFRKQVRFLKATHDVLPMSEALQHLRNGTRLRRPVAVITFDDGYRSVFEWAHPIMREEDVVGTCFVSTSFVGTDRRFDHDADLPVRPFLEVMDWDELDDLRANGWEVGGHTRNHRRVSDLTGVELRDEVGGTMKDLRAWRASLRPTFAYPFGGAEDISPAAQAAAARAGFTVAFQDYGGDLGPGQDPHRLPRYELGGDRATLSWKATTVGMSPRRLIGSRFDGLRRVVLTRERGARTRPTPQGEVGAGARGQVPYGD